MDTHGLIALCRQHRCHGFGLIVDILQHRVAAVLEECIGVACQELVFRVAGAAAPCRYHQMTGDRVFLLTQRADKRHDIVHILQMQIAQIGEIGKGLIHDGDDIWILFVGFFYRVYILAVCENIFGSGCRVAARFRIKHRTDVHDKVKKHTVLAVCRDLTPCTDVEVSLSEYGNQREGDDQHE